MSSPFALRTVTRCTLGLLMLGASLGGAVAQQGRGLTLSASTTEAIESRWTSRIGVVTNGPDTALAQHDPYALTAGTAEGLRVHSVHVLSDYHFAGGFRATAGLLRGATQLPWWSDPMASTSVAGMSLSHQRLNLLGANGMPGQGLANGEPYRTVPYVGAGYTGRLTDGVANSDFGVWRFNADMGLISLNSDNIGRVGRVLQGHQGVDELLRELRLRPVVKFSVQYAF